jgi:hypothetical protein
MTADTRHRIGGNVFMSLVAGPLLGLLYVIVLPFIAVGTVAAAVGKKLLEGAAGLAGSIVSFGWRPLEAHLGGKKKGRKRKVGKP